MAKSYGVIVIGAGSGGLTAAATAKGFFQSVALIEGRKTGGECTHYGCMPSKALINYAEKVHAASEVTGKKTKNDSKKALEYVRTAIENIYAHETPEVLGKSYDIYEGYAKFIDAHTVEVNGEQLTAKKIIISTGSSPMIPTFIKGIENVDYLTNENIFYQEQLPDSLIALGGGPIGVELCQALGRLGIEVTVVEMMPRILPREEERYSQMITEVLEKEGMHICTGAKATEVRQENGVVTLTIEKDGKTSEISAGGILMSLGRVPNIDKLNLEAAGIEYDRKGIKVSKTLETTAKGVYAVGDVVGPYQFSHMANYQGILATQNAVIPVISRGVNYTHKITWTTFTDPELARCGLTEDEAKEAFGEKNVRVYTESYDTLERAETKLGSIGEVKLVLDKKGKILGATVIGDRAGEIISEIQVLKTLGINVSKLSGVLHPYPTYAEILVKFGKRVAVDNIFRMPVVKQVMAIVKK
ncbi:MAG: NAD(P)/FAD-dependent oxidoreductase [Clostridiales bacterium]|nr:NAD(P)/FAD-dependent oxidoreductase [Clostridiales bacterium]